MRSATRQALPRERLDSRRGEVKTLQRGAAQEVEHAAGQRSAGPDPHHRNVRGRRARRNQVPSLGGSHIDQRTVEQNDIREVTGCLHDRFEGRLRARNTRSRESQLLLARAPRGIVSIRDQDMDLNRISRGTGERGTSWPNRRGGHRLEGLAAHARESSKNAARTLGLPGAERSLQPDRQETAGAERNEVQVCGVTGRIHPSEKEQPHNPSEQAEGYPLRGDAQAGAGAAVRIGQMPLAAGTSRHEFAGPAGHHTTPRDRRHRAAMAHALRRRVVARHLPDVPDAGAERVRRVGVVTRAGLEPATL